MHRGASGSEAIPFLPALKADAAWLGRVIQPLAGRNPKKTARALTPAPTERRTMTTIRTSLDGVEFFLAPTLTEAAFKKWEAGLEKQFPRELETLQKTFRAQLTTVRSDAARDLVKRKLAAVNLRLLGPLADEDKPPKTKTASPKPAQDEP